MPATIRAVLIDEGDGSLIVPPPAAPAPQLPPAPPPPPLAPPPSSGALDPVLLAAAGVTQAQVDAANEAARIAEASAGALLAGQGSAGIAAAAQAAGAPESTLDALIAAAIPDLSGVLVIGAEPAGDGVEGTDDFGAAQAEALANLADLTGLPDYELLDPFGLQAFAVTNPSLKGGGALTAIAQACADYGVDPLATIADAIHEGASGAIGDGGLAYGPFQDHLTEFEGRPFYGKGRNNRVVNAWAWSENGIRYSVRQMAAGSPSARGLHGHAAVYAIVYGYERPADKPGAYRTRAAEYDKLVRLGSGWASYAAPLFKGPAAGGAVDSAPITSGADAPYKPAGVTAQWRSLIDVFKVSLPKQHAKADNLSKSLVEVFK
jgi:hypothetical protein